MKNLRGIYIIWYRDVLRFWRDRMRFIGSISQPLLFLFIFGGGLSSRLGSFGEGIDFSRFIFPGIIGMTVLMSSFMAGVSVVWDREFGFLKEVLVSPVSRISVVLGKTLGGTTVALSQGVTLLLLAPVMGVRIPPSRLSAILLVMFLMAAVTSSLGILLATRIHTMEGFQAIMQLVIFPMIFLAGVFFPIQGLPSWLNFFVKANPVTYGIAALREATLGKIPDSPFAVVIYGYTVPLWGDIIILVVLGTLAIIMAMWSFSHQE